jgi:hypothetical protein
MLLPATERPRSPHTSIYDPTRENIGKIYRDLQIQNTPEYIEIGDMGRELANSLLEDINEAFASFDLKGRKSYFLLIEEKKDLQMKQAILRRMHYFGYRPYPEDNTIVFWRNPKNQETKFCWCLPHHSEMDLTLMNQDQFDPEYISQIKAWKDVDLKPFGFYYQGKEFKWIPNPKWKDKPLA